MITTTFADIDLVRLHKLTTAIASLFPTQLVIGLVGTLGAGKTTFTQSLASAMGIDPSDVTSPTFTLLCSYQARIAAGNIRLHHLDAYRLHDEDEFLELGVEELFDDDHAWTLIEWADRVASILPPETLWIDIDIAAPEGSNPAIDPLSPLRVITLQCADAQLLRTIEMLSQTMQG